MGAIQQTRYDELLRRTTDQYGGGSKLGEALEDLFPVIEVENAPSELLRAVGWHLGAAQIGVAPAAATRASVQLFNPVGSGNLVVLTSIFIQVGSTAIVSHGPSFAALTSTNLPGQQRDTRRGVLTNTVARVQEQDDALVAALLQYIGTSNVLNEFSDPNDIAVLTPGSGWRVSTVEDDIVLRVSFLYRERKALGSELNF